MNTNQETSSSTPLSGSCRNNPILQSQMLRFHPSGKQLVFKGPFVGMSDEGRRKSPFAGQMPRVELVDEPPAVECLQNGDVRFRFYAPNAKTVAVAGLGGGFSREHQPMELQEDGWWQTTLPGIQPGFYYHEYFVDGNRMVNPDANCGYGCFYGINFFDLTEIGRAHV